FSAYPTRHLGLEDRLSLAAGATEASIAESLARPLASYARINRPTPAEVAAVVTWLAGNPGACVAELVEGFPQARRSVVRRGLLWMARHGVLEISPAR
ncbi:MAG: hypothetical protein ACREEG_17005, partial [Phenylobacterium sp.]